jgi:hypothetical protein
MNPTHDMSSLDASEEFWHRYLRMLDANVRHKRARDKSCAGRSVSLPPPDSSQGEHPEDFCELCGGPNIKPWFAPSPIWNKVANDHSVLCPQCFVALARRVGIDPVWRLAPDDYTGPDDDPERMAGRENANKAEPSGLGSVDSADLPNILSPATPPPSSPQVAVADGYAIVPLEPTQAMKDAWAQYKINCANSGTQRTAGGHYRAMIAAAPAAPQSAPKAAEPPCVDWEHGRYPGKITQHWLRVAFGRIAAGEPEREVLFDYGYVPEKVEEPQAVLIEPEARHWREAMWQFSNLSWNDESFYAMDRLARELAQAEQAAKGDK